MINFLNFLIEAEEEGAKLKHIHHAEDRPLLHGEDGFEHAYGALQAAHHHTLQGLQSHKMTMKYDGSPSVVFGHHPENGKFFVASKSAFNKNPKINYTPEDIDKNHGHAPGLADKLKGALKHFPKVAPKEGVYQGDLMYTHDDLKKKGDKVSFTPNTITYTAKGDKAEAIKKSKIGVVIHTRYEGDKLSSMSAHHNVSGDDFSQHPDVFHHTADYDASGAHYSKESQDSFNKHMSAARAIHAEHKGKMYKATAMHQGDGGHLATYINQTVRDNSTPSAEGLKDHIAGKYEKMVSKLKTEKSQNAKLDELKGHLDNIKKHQGHYDNLLKMHGHLQSAKNELVKSLETNEGSYEHAINGEASKPEGFVYNHTHNGVTEPTKLVNRAEFARQNLLKARVPNKPADEKHHVLAFGRMNPPTAGHEEVVKQLKDTAKKVGGGHTLILSGSHNTKDGKNPLSPERKLHHAKNAFPNTNIKVADSSSPTLLHQASDLHKQGVSHLHFVGGSDRKPMHELLQKYNGVEGKHGYYNFKSINFHSSGDRDENAKGVAGISGTKLRELASSGKKAEFHSHLSSQMKPEHKEELYKDLRHAMSVKESYGVIDHELILEYIVKSGSGYEVKSEKGKNLGHTDSLAGAKKRLKQIEYFKYLKR